MRILQISLICSIACGLNLLPIASPIDTLSRSILSSAVAQTETEQQTEADRLFQEGVQHLRANQLREALGYLEQALTLYQSIKDHRSEGRIAGLIGSTRLQLGEYNEALAILEQGLATIQLTQDDEIEDTLLSLLTSAAELLNDSSRATDYRQERLNLARSRQDRATEATVLQELGGVAADYRTAIDYYEQSLVIGRSLNDSELISRSLSAIASAYYGVGNLPKATAYTQQAFAVVQTVADPVTAIQILTSLGNIQLYGLAEFDTAIRSFEQALSLARTNQRYRPFEAQSLVSLGTAHMVQGNFTQALEYLKQGKALNHDMKLALTKPIDSAIEAHTLGLIAEAYIGLGESDAAVTYAQQSLEMIQTNPNFAPQGKLAALGTLGTALFYANDLNGAERALREALQGFESVRSGFDTEDVNQVSYTDMYSSVFYEILQQVLIAQNKPVEALEVAERSRGKALADLLATRLSFNRFESLDAPPISASLQVEQIQRIAREQNATLVIYSTIYDGNQARLPGRIQGLQPDQASALFVWVVKPNGEIEFRSTDLKAFRQQHKTTLSQLVNTSRDAIGARGRNQDKARIEIVLTPEAKARQQAEQLQNLQNLHQLLIEPIKEALPTNPDEQVIFIPQGELFSVPFAALVDANDKYLIENHTILTVPSIQILDLTYQQRQRLRQNSPNTDEVLVVGNPIMPEVWNPDTQRAQQLSALRGAEEEAITIANAFETQPLLWDSATETMVKQRMQNARIIHLATHGLLEYGDLRESGVRDFPGAIALAPSVQDNGLLTSSEIYDMNLNAELVILSACDTGRGNITGDGVIGLSRSFMQAGVPSVVVSLWKVPDDATQFLMTRFYQHWQSNSDKAQALRQAMKDTMEQYPDPINWAAFMLIGEAE